MGGRGGGIDGGCHGGGGGSGGGTDGGSDGGTLGGGDGGGGDGALTTTATVTAACVSSTTTLRELASEAVNVAASLTVWTTDAALSDGLGTISHVTMPVAASTATEAIWSRDRPGMAANRASITCVSPNRARGLQE